MLLKKKCGWIGMCAVLASMVSAPVGFATEADDWPIRLVVHQSGPGGPNQWTVVAHNRADFPCTKLRLSVTIVGGTLVRGTGQSPATLADGKLTFQEVASIQPGAEMKWYVDFTPESERSITMRAQLDYAEKLLEKPAPKKDCAGYMPPVGKDMSVSEIAFPTGSRSTSALVVHQVMPVEVEKRKPYTYQYYVTNITQGTLQNVELTATSFRNLSVSKAEPAGETVPDGLRWMLGDLASCETKIINVTATSAEVGTASACLTATFANRLCAMTKVVEPALKLQKTAPPEALVCDEVEMVLTVTNPGSGYAREVKLSDDLPEGLATRDGKRRVEGDAGNLGPGESKQLPFKVKASKPGSYTNMGVAKAAGDLTAESNKTTTVFRQPVLTISCSAPEQRFIGRNATFTYEVKNTGDAPAANTTVKATLPSGAEMVSVSKGGTSGRGEASWNLGTLAPGASQSVSFEVKATSGGVLQSSATASAVCAAAVSANCQTKVMGIPAILLEVIDIEDPVELGKQTTYVITVTNQGSAPGTNIKIGVTVPAESTYVSSGGATAGTAAGNRVTFAPLASLAPKQKAEWRLTVTAKSEGDARLAVEMTSDQFTEPVRETESTNHYK